MQGYDPVSFEALQAQLADALYNPTLPKDFQCKVRSASNGCVLLPNLGFYCKSVGFSSSHAQRHLMCRPRRDHFRLPTQNSVVSRRERSA